mgnify:CR=1 FL=1
MGVGSFGFSNGEIMERFESPQILGKDTYHVSNTNSMTTNTECKEGYPGGGGAETVGSGWCKQ